MHRLADLVEQGVDAVRAALAADDAGGFLASDRERAADEVYSLATRRQQTRMQRVGEPLGDDEEIGGLGLPIHRPSLREADALFALALALHYDSFQDYSRGFVLEHLGEFEAAARVFEGVTGSHAKHGAEQAARCRRKASGTYDADAEHQAAFDDLIDRIEGSGRVAGPVRRALSTVLSLLGRFAGGGASAKPQAPSKQHAPPEQLAPPLDADRLDRASLAAQVFAEHLVDGDFAAARAMLAAELGDLTTDTLREAYTAMTSYADDGDDEPRVLVMMAQGDMPDLQADDLGWVYVAISGESFNEAITVVVALEQGEARIRQLEWGRP